MCEYADVLNLGGNVADNMLHLVTTLRLKQLATMPDEAMTKLDDAGKEGTHIA